jgi:hypothetical protein
MRFCMPLRLHNPKSNLRAQMSTGRWAYPRLSASNSYQLDLLIPYRSLDSTVIACVVTAFWSQCCLGVMPPIYSLASYVYVNRLFTIIDLTVYLVPMIPAQDHIAHSSSSTVLPTTINHPSCGHVIQWLRNRFDSHKRDTRYCSDPTTARHRAMFGPSQLSAYTRLSVMIPSLKIADRLAVVQYIITINNSK